MNSIYKYNAENAGYEDCVIRYKSSLIRFVFSFNRHENASGFYRVSSYFFSKILCDFVPMRLVPLCAYSVITYFMVGKNTTVLSSAKTGIKYA